MNNREHRILAALLSKGLLGPIAAEKPGKMVSPGSG